MVPILPDKQANGNQKITRIHALGKFIIYRKIWQIYL
jgi:hypothetical protein